MARRDGQIIARGERRWLVRWHLGQGDDGKYRYKSKMIHGTKRDAQKFLNQVLRSRDLGTYVEPARISLNAYFDEWLKTAAKPKLASRTYEDYRRLLKRYVRGPLGIQRLDSIRPLDVQHLYTDMRERGIGPRTVRMTHAVLSSALKQAVRWGMLAQNPASLVELPKQERREKRAMTPEEVAAFRKAARGTRWEALWEFLLTTGCRPGEALGLRWQDFDVKKGEVTIRQARSETKPGHWEMKEPKARARRTIPLPDRVVRLLVRHRSSQSAYRLLRGTSYVSDLDLVFASRTGGPLSPVNLKRRHLRPIVDATKIETPREITLYTFRHTCATLSLKAGVDVRVVAERLGHANPKMVLDVYAHVLPGMQAEATERLEAVLGGQIR